MKPFATLVLLLSVPAVSLAHGLVVRLDLVGPAVAVTVTFDDDEPADDCVVTVTAEGGTVVAKGPTDKKGLFTFPRPAPGTYAVSADAGAGHVAKQTLTVAAEGEATPAAPLPDPPRSKTNVGALVAIGCSLIAVFTAAAARRRRAKQA